jgi:tetratricopeptide (TPR) repeat protein
MKKFFLVIFFLTSVVVGQEASLQFEQANQLYRNGEYQKAAQMYEQIQTNGYENASLYYNLGNSYFKLHNIPGALLSFERAKRLAPHDEDISYNLRLANVHIIDKIEPLPRLFFIEWWQNFIGLFSSDGWAIVGLVTIWSAVVCGVLFFIIRSMIVQRITVLFGVTLIVVAMIAGVGMFQQLHHEQNEQYAIVFSPSMPVKSAPDAQSVDLFVIHEGLKVEILDAVGEWKKIRLADGKVGWMSAEAMQMI